jgi:hypothetical protein
MTCPSPFVLVRIPRTEADGVSRPDRQSPSALDGQRRLAMKIVYADSPRSRKDSLANRRNSDTTVGMIRRGFLDSESRKDLTELTRDGAAAHRLARHGGGDATVVLGVGG